MKPGGKVLLFFSSYLPCWIIYAISQGFTLNVISFFGVLLTLISLITLYVFKKTYEVTTRDTLASIIIKKISNGSSEVLSYLVSLIIPTATSTVFFDLQKGNYSLDILVTIVISVTIFLIYINSNLVVVNPVLMIYGYSLYLIDYKVSDESETTVDGILITKHTINPEEIPTKMNLQRIDQSVYLLYTGE